MHHADIAARPAAKRGDLPFRLLADHLPALCFMADRSGRVRWCNRRWYDYTGVSRDADAAEVWPSLLDPETLEEVYRRWDVSVRSGKAGEMVIPMRGADARFRPFLTRAEPVQGANGTVDYWLGTMTEIGDQWEAEQNGRFLVKLSDALRDKSEPADILSITGRMLGMHLDVLRVGYGEVGADENTVQTGARGWQATREPRLAAKADLDSFGIGLAEQLRRGEVSVVADTRGDATVGTAADAHLSFGIQASVTVPLIKAGRLAAFLYAHSAAPRAWRASEVQLVREVAERTWATLERAGADAARRISEAHLRESEARLRAIVDATPECVKLVAYDGSIEHMNAAGLRMMEVGPDALGGDMSDIIAPEYRKLWSQQHKRVCAGASLVWEWDVIGRKGTRRRLETHAVPFRGSDGRMGQLAVSRDITERKAAEAALAESEERFRRVIETAHEGIWIVDDNGETLFVNDRMASLLGTTREEMRGAVVPTYCFPEDLEEARARITNNLTGKSEQFEFRFRRADGSVLPVLAATTPLQDGQGQIVGAVGMFSDLTERKCAEERLRDSQALLAAFRNNAPIGMYMKDADGRYLMLNPEMEKVFGLPLDEVLGRTADDLFAPNEAAMIKGYDREVLNTCRARSDEEYLSNHEEYSWSLVVRFPIALDDGKPMRIGGFDIDISNLKRAEAELQRSREALYQSEKLTALGSLLAGVSHELNNPLSVVLTHSELLEQKAAGTDFAERAAKIHAAAARCGRIVQTFLAMARQKAPVRTQVDVNRLVADTLDLTGYSLRTTGINVERHLAPGLPPIEGDADQLAQVLVNLVVNAQHALLESTLEGERLLIVRTLAGERGRTVRIEVEDNGPGIPSKFRRRIFDPFFTSKPQGQGTGIGLTLSLGVVEAHCGSLRLADQQDGGACFTVELPALVDKQAPRSLTDAPLDQGVRSGRALVIDDEPDLGDALAELMEDEGFTVDVTRCGEDAKAMIDAHRYDAVLTDLRMPGVDGPALLEWLEKKHPQLIDRLAFVTGDTLGPAAAHFLDRANRPTLEKPFDRAALQSLLSQLGPPQDA